MNKCIQWQLIINPVISLTVWLMSVNNDLNYRNMFVSLIFCWRIVRRILLFTLLSWGIIALGVSRNSHILLKKTTFGMYGLILLVGIGFSAGFFILDQDPTRYIGTVLPNGAPATYADYRTISVFWCALTFRSTKNTKARSFLSHELHEDALAMGFWLWAARSWKL